jgi:threonine dehydrogenase-like Zn-dependent dehydrogenase
MWEYVAVVRFLSIGAVTDANSFEDLHEYTSGPVLVPKSEHPITGEKSPVTMGHEFSGIIEEVGEGVTQFSPGQRAVVRPTIYDETCAACTQGSRHCCKNIGFIGLSGMSTDKTVLGGSLIPRRIWRWNGRVYRRSS